MAQPIIMPKFGQATEESSIVKWHKKVGDTIRKGEIIFEIETDKAVLEVESFVEGTLLKIVVPEKVVVPVSAVVAYVGAPGEKVPDAPPPVPAAPPPPPSRTSTPTARPPSAAPQAPASQAPLPAPARTAPAVQPAAPAAAVAPSRLFISPKARALAKSKAIDPARITGTGPNGRITTKDVQSYLDARNYGALRISPSAKKLAIMERVDILTVHGTGASGRIMAHDVERALAERPQVMSKMRQVIARRLTESFTTTPHFYVTTSADMTNLMAYRKELKDRGETYTVTDFIFEAVILSLKEHPRVNSVFENNAVRWRGSVELGMAVSIEAGLVVPVIRRAEDLGMKELHDQAQTLAAKAREGKLLPDEMSGSSFTVSNMGMMNVENFMAIINPGEGAILAVSSAIDTVVARDNRMAIRSMMKMTLSVDHRIIDGALAATFVNAVKTKLEDVELWKSLTW